MNTKSLLLVTGIFACSLLPLVVLAQPVLPSYNITWNSPSRNAAESMPCGGGDIGLNVWAQNGELFLYMAKSGSFDENNALLKSGRIRVKCTPNAFDGDYFKQELKLEEGYIQIDGRNNKLQTTIKVWVDVFRPVIHIDVSGNEAVKTEVSFESWRYWLYPYLYDWCIASFRMILRFLLLHYLKHRYV